LQYFKGVYPFQVLSVHAAIVNLRVKDWPYLFMVASPLAGYGPAVVGLDEAIFFLFSSFADKYRKGFVRPNSLLIGEEEKLLLTWENALSYSFAPPSLIKTAPKNIKQSVACYKKWLGEKDIASASAVLLNKKAGEDFFRKQILEFFPGLVQALQANDVSFFLDRCQKLVGLGRGSSPTADDLIFGALVSCHYLSSARLLYFAPLFIPEEIKKNTTLLGAHMLEMGCRGLAPAVVRNFLLSIFEGKPYVQALEKLCSMGASTGLDIAVSVLFVLTKFFHD
ncbi:MAG: DUF2877 domain-containing protein, partial [Firmicutes bacterium]|nr:DUF2877 domain-containing protein [Bacillota bacterium]